MRIPVSPREKATYIKLRKKGYTVNVLAEAFGRSMSIVSRTLAKARTLYGQAVTDLRRIPRRVRELHARYSPRTLQKYLKLWEAWIMSDEGQPP